MNEQNQNPAAEPELSAQAKEAKEEIRRSMAEHGGVLRASAADLIFRRKILTIPNLIRILLDIYQETGRLPFDAEETEDWKEKMMGMVRKEAGNDPRIAQVIETAAAMTAVDPLTLPDDAEVMSAEEWDQAMRIPSPADGHLSSPVPGEGAWSGGAALHRAFCDEPLDGRLFHDG